MKSPKIIRQLITGIIIENFNNDFSKSNESSKSANDIMKVIKELSDEEIKAIREDKFI